MVGEVNEKLLKIVQLCAEKDIKVAFTQYIEKENSIEETIELGTRMIIIQIRDGNDKKLPQLLEKTLSTL